eukprot:SAG22_NODE_4431_length_1271_cov_1.898464_1_plen_124_part_10
MRFHCSHFTEDRCNQTELIEHAIEARDVAELEVAIARADATGSCEQLKKKAMVLLEMLGKEAAVKTRLQVSRVRHCLSAVLPLGLCVCKTVPSLAGCLCSQNAVEHEREADLQYALAEAKSIEY